MNTATHSSLATVERSMSTINAADWGLLALRVVLGIIFFAHGSQKVLGWFGGHGLAASVQAMHQFTGIPVFLGYVAAFTEFFAGIALIVGFLSRLAALGIFIDMVVAVATVHGKNGFFLGGPKLGFEYNLALIGMAVAVLLAGPGRLSLADPELHLLRKRR